jgi:branched-chain amino acid transport system substrate-binding protein
MQTRRRFTTLAACALAVVLTTSACGSGSDDSASSSSGTIKIGVLSDTVNALAFFGQEANKGWDVALQSIGAKIAGKKVQYLKAQCSTPAECTTATDKLVRQDKVGLIMGTPGSALALAISQEAARLGKVYFETASLANGLLPAGDAKFIFRGSYSSTIQSQNAIDALQTVYKELGRNFTDAKILLVNEGSAANHDSAQVQLDLLKGLGVHVIDDFEYDVTSVDFGALAAKIAAAKPEVLLETSYIPDSIPLNKQLAARGFKPSVIHLIDGAASPKDQLAGESKAYLAGTLQVGYPGLDIKTPGMTEFSAEYRKKFKADPESGFPLTYYTSARILFDVLKEADGKTDPASFKAAAMKIDKPLGAYANGWGAKFDSNGQNTRALAAIQQWQDGAVCTVLPKEYASCELGVG